MSQTFLPAFMPVRKQHLKHIGISRPAWKRYRMAVPKFLAWVKSRQKHYPCTFVALDFWLSEYINHLWMDDLPSSLASYTVAALQRLVPGSRRRLRTAWQNITNWQRVATPVRTHFASHGGLGPLCRTVTPRSGHGTGLCRMSSYWWTSYPHC